MTEAERTFVCSRGILHSCEFHHTLPVSDSSYVAYRIRDRVSLPYIRVKPLVIYIPTSAIWDFVDNYMIGIRSPFVLVTGDSDYTIPDSFPKQTQEILTNPKLVAWFAQNCIYSHPKLHQIPIGLDYHTMNRGDGCWGEKATPEEQENTLLNIVKTPFWERIPKCHGSFHFVIGNRPGQLDRIDAYEKIPKDLIDYEESGLPRKEMWEKMAKYAFIPSPHGNGLDCHRTWEALSLGCIVIVRTSGLDPLYKDLPVWIVKEWSDITPESIQEVIESFKHKKFNEEKLTLKYWVDKIKDYAR